MVLSIRAIFIGCFAVVWCCIFCNCSRNLPYNVSGYGHSNNITGTSVKVKSIDVMMARYIINGEYDKAVKKSSALLTSSFDDKETVQAATFWMDFALLMMGVVQVDDKELPFKKKVSSYKDRFRNLPDELEIRLLTTLMSILNDQLILSERKKQKIEDLSSQKAVLASRLKKMKRLIRDLESVK